MMGVKPAPSEGKLSSGWPAPERVPLLRQSEAHVWCACLDDSPNLVERSWYCLADEERERAARFHFKLHRDRFVTGRAILRRLLGAYLDREPGGIGLVYGPAGKPALQVAGGIEFNVAHSGRAALFAFAREAVGVDIEEMKAAPESESIAERFFSPGERERLRRLPEAERERAFLRCWTRKEAFLKTAGTGIAAGLKSFEVSFESDGEAAVLARAGAPAGETSLHHLNPAAGFVGALHICNPYPRLRCHYFEPALLD